MDMPALSELDGARRSKSPPSLTPQLATLVREVPSGSGWLHEIKFDGYRVLCSAKPRDARLTTRAGKDWTDRFPRVARAAATLPVPALLDGEVVVLDREGRSDFQALQNAHGASLDAMFFYAFDVPWLDGWDLRAAPLATRKELLERLLADVPPALRYADHVRGEGAEFLREACGRGLEGIISKRAEAPYRSGRSRDWRKVKCELRQEFVVVGWTDPSGSRVGLGALVIAVHGPDGALRYAGRVGTGYSTESLLDLARRLKPLARGEPAVENPPRGAKGREVHWVDPVLVAEVSFTEWTQDGVVRHPVFHGLREDKAAREVVREEAEARPRGRASRKA